MRTQTPFWGLLSQVTTSLRFYNIFAITDCFRFNTAFFYFIFSLITWVHCILYFWVYYLRPLSLSLRCGRWLLGDWPTLVPTPECSPHISRCRLCPGLSLVRESQPWPLIGCLPHNSHLTNQESHPCGAILRPAFTPHMPGVIRTKISWIWNKTNVSPVISRKS